MKKKKGVKTSKKKEAAQLQTTNFGVKNATQEHLDEMSYEVQRSKINYGRPLTILQAQ